MPGFMPGIHVLRAPQRGKTWMAGTSPAMTMRGGNAHAKARAAQCRPLLSAHSDSADIHHLIRSPSFTLEGVQDKQPDGGGEIVVVARRIDRCDQFRQRQAPGPGNFFQIVPESIFKADTGLVSIDDDGPFDD